VNTNEMRYPAIFHRESADEWVVRFPGLEGALTGARTLEQAETEAVDCLGSWLASALAEKREIPSPATAKRGQRMVSVPLWIAPKVALYRIMVNSGINNSELARRLGVRETVVRRMLDPDHATKLGNIERALLAAGAHMFLALDAA
jgi:antitoxin HicB